MAANAQMTSYVDVTSLTSCQDTVLKFGDDIASKASDRRHFRRDTRLRFVTFWAGCYEVTLP